MVRLLYWLEGRGGATLSSHQRRALTGRHLERALSHTHRQKSFLILVYEEIMFSDKDQKRLFQILKSMICGLIYDLPIWLRKDLCDDQL